MTTSSPVWHPFTQHRTAPPAINVARASGARLHRADGGTLIDAISSWWVITHGHCHPRIVEAVKRQAEELDQVIFAGFTHPPAERLAEELVKLVPAELTRVFYSDSGSTAVEVALKMALGYWHNLGHQRTRVIVLEHAYHGDTIGTMSAGERGVFNAAYAPLLFDVVRLPFPETGREAAVLEELEAQCRTGDVAALVVEPLVLGAGGMLMWDAATLKEMRRITKAHDVLLIADEVMTGWGRTGTVFACDQAGVTPDIMCIAKGLTGGYLPLAATFATEPIFAAHYSEDRSKTFFHSSSFTANPLCCAAALENVQIWKDEPVRERITQLAEKQSAALARQNASGLFKNCRQCGTITAVDIDVPDSGYLAGIGPALQRTFLERGVLLRPLGNTIYVMPPYCISDDELSQVYEVLEAGVRSVLAEARA
ncbi:MAG: adenosylmethionine--8-amino-7-oxononanoate transaminase [Filomicrobium sp.]